ncbi:uncharacterized protein V1518DRAFT_403306 [Limtongia smithiae]|uniref:uncharacterized protein n=1 Tax=Limtongia smithiae TaxID=1125753 RepID=UPI0034CEE0E0
MEYHAGIRTSHAAADVQVVLSPSEGTDSLIDYFDAHGNRYTLSLLVVDQDGARNLNIGDVEGLEHYEPSLENMQSSCMDPEMYPADLEHETDHNISIAPQYLYRTPETQISEYAVSCPSSAFQTPSQSDFSNTPGFPGFVSPTSANSSLIPSPYISAVPQTRVSVFPGLSAVSHKATSEVEQGATHKSTQFLNAVDTAFSRLSDLATAASHLKSPATYTMTSSPGNVHKVHELPQSTGFQWMARKLELLHNDEFESQSELHVQVPGDCTPQDQSPGQREYQSDAADSSSKPRRMFKCAICGQKLSRKSTLQDHENRMHKRIVNKFCCDVCHQELGSLNDLRRHRESIHEQKRHSCRGGCGKSFSRTDGRKKHERNCKGIPLIFPIGD